MRTFCLRANKNAVSPVIGTILMVAITVVLAAVLYVMVTGLVQSPQTAKPTVSLSSGSWSGGNLVITITSASSGNIDTAGLTFQVLANNGTTFFNGASGSSTAQQGTTTTVTYNDAGGTGALKVGPDDNIVISVSPITSTALRSTTFKVFQGTDVLGTAVLP